MSFQNQFKEYAKFTYEQNYIDVMTGYLKIFNTITWSKDLQYRLNYVENINFDNIYNDIVKTFFFNNGGKEEKNITISDDGGNKYEYKYKKDEYYDNITIFYLVETSLTNIQLIFENAKKQNGGMIFSNPADKTIGKIFEEIDNKLFKNISDKNFLKHLKFEFLEPLNSDATKYMNDELEEGNNFKYYFHVKFFKKLIEIFIININKFKDETNYVESLYQAEIEDKEASTAAEQKASEQKAGAAEAAEQKAAAEREAAAEAAEREAAEQKAEAAEREAAAKDEARLKAVAEAALKKAAAAKDKAKEYISQVDELLNNINIVKKNAAKAKEKAKEKANEKVAAADAAKAKKANEEVAAADAANAKSAAEKAANAEKVAAEVAEEAAAYAAKAKKVNEEVVAAAASEALNALIITAEEKAVEAETAAKEAENKAGIIKKYVENIKDKIKKIISLTITPNNSDDEEEEQTLPEQSTPTPEQSAEDKKLEKKLLNYIFEYSDEKIIKKRIKLLKAKYGLDLNEKDLDSFALYSDSLKDILDTSTEQPRQQLSQSTIDITTRDVNTFIDILAKYKFSYNLNDIESDIKKFKKLCSKLGIGNIIDDDTAKKILNYYFQNGKLDKSRFKHLYDNENVKPSNESENLRAFNILLKSLDNQNIEDIFKKVYTITPNNNDDSKKNFKIFKQLFSDSDGKFKISSISKLF